MDLNPLATYVKDMPALQKKILEEASPSPKVQGLGLNPKPETLNPQPSSLKAPKPKLLSLRR